MISKREPRHESQSCSKSANHRLLLSWRLRAFHTVRENLQSRYHCHRPIVFLCLCWRVFFLFMLESFFLFMLMRFFFPLPIFVVRFTYISIRSKPPPFICTLIRVAPASIEFSTSSLITDNVIIYYYI